MVNFTFFFINYKCFYFKLLLYYINSLGVSICPKDIHKFNENILIEITDWYI